MSENKVLGLKDSNQLLGNKHAKRDITKEMARHIVWKELHWAAKVCCELPTHKLKEAIKNGLLDDESIMTHSLIKKFAQGDSRTIRFLTEMIVGKAVQQIDNTSTNDTERIERLEDYIKRTRGNQS